MSTRVKRRVIASGFVTMLLAWIVAWVWERGTTKKLQAYTEDPAPDYENALARFAEMQSREEADPRLNPLCRSKLLTHGRKVENVIVLIHGMTNCPISMSSLRPYFMSGDTMC